MEQLVSFNIDLIISFYTTVHSSKMTVTFTFTFVGFVFCLCLTSCLAFTALNIDNHPCKAENMKVILF